MLPRNVSTAMPSLSCPLVISRIKVLRPPEREIDLGPRTIAASLGRNRRLLPLIRKLANQAHAIDEGVENGVSPAARYKRSGLLIQGFVRFSKEAQALPRRRRGEFLHGDAKGNVTPGLALHDGKKVQLGELLRGIFLRKLPIAHPSDPWVG